MGEMLAIAAALLAWAGQGDPHSKADLVAAKSVVAAGSTVDVALRFRMDPGWHVYWKNPGESGIPPKIDWKLPKGWSVGPIEWPVPERIENGGVVNYAYEKEVLLLMKVKVPSSAKAGAAVLKGTATWLCCREACIPGKSPLSLNLKVGSSEVSDSKWSARFLQVRSSMPATVKGVQFAANAKGSSIALQIRTNSPTPAFERARFFPADDAIEPSAAQVVTTVKDGVLVTLKVSPYVSKAPVRLRGILVAQSGDELSPGRNAVPVDIPIQRSTQ